MFFWYLAWVRALWSSSERSFAKTGMVRRPRVAELHTRKKVALVLLADEIEKIIARRLDKLRTQEHVVVNVVHADRQRPHGDRDVCSSGVSIRAASPALGDESSLAICRPGGAISTLASGGAPGQGIRAVRNQRVRRARA